MPATTNARIGATIAGAITFSTMASPWIASAPSATNAEPMMPPISACEDDDGSPNHQVTRFQVIAPIRPPKTIVGVMASADTMPLAIVAATSSEMNAPTKFRIEAMSTAARGDIARVEMLVAIALAVSWNPFVKSNASAVATTMYRTMSLSTTGLRVLDDDALEHVGHVLAGVDRLLEALVDVLPADHDHGVDAVVEQGGHGLSDYPVAVVLKAVDLDRVVAEVLEAAHARQGLGNLARGL